MGLFSSVGWSKRERFWGAMVVLRPISGKNAPPQGGSAGSVGGGFLLNMARMGASKPLCDVADGLIVTNITRM